MNGLILASYVFKAQQQERGRNADYVRVHERAHANAWRALVSLGVSVASLTVFLVALDVFL